MFELYIKYLLEGIAVAVAAYFIPRKKVEVSEIIFIALSAAATFAVLDIFAPKVGDGARKGAGFGIGANTVGWPMGGAENFQASDQTMGSNDSDDDSDDDSSESDDSDEKEHFYQVPVGASKPVAMGSELECVQKIQNLKKRVEVSKDKVKKAVGKKRETLLKKIQKLEKRIKKLEEKLKKMGEAKMESAKKADVKKKEYFQANKDSTDCSVTSTVSSAVSSAVSTVTGSSDTKSADTKSADTKSADTKSADTKSTDSSMMSMDSTGTSVSGYDQTKQYSSF
jgi:hypothetical protein